MKIRSVQDPDLRQALADELDQQSSVRQRRLRISTSSPATAGSCCFQPRRRHGSHQDDVQPLRDDSRGAGPANHPELQQRAVRSRCHAGSRAGQPDQDDDERAQRVRRACLEHRLQAAERRQGKEPHPDCYKALVSAACSMNASRKSSMRYKVEPATCSLRNILSGSGFACRKIDFTADSAGHAIQWREQDGRLRLRALELGGSALRTLAPARGALPRGSQR